MEASRTDGVRVGDENHPLPDMDFAEGTVIVGRYRIERQLGAGGMARVVLAVDLLLRRKVARDTQSNRLWDRRELKRADPADAGGLDHRHRFVPLAGASTGRAGHRTLRYLLRAEALLEVLGLMRTAGPDPWPLPFG